MWVEVEFEVLCRTYRVCSSNECACCACDPSVYLSVPSIRLVWYVVLDCHQYDVCKNLLAVCMLGVVVGMVV